MLVYIKMQDDLALLLDQLLNDDEAVPGSLMYHKVSQTLIARCKVGFCLFYMRFLIFLCSLAFNCPLLFTELV